MSERDETYGRPSSTSVATGPLMFVICLALLLGGFWLMAVAFDHESGLIFGTGLLASSLAFIIPIHVLRD